MQNVIGLGSLNYDYIYLVKTHANADQQVVIDGSKGSPGGSAANVIFGLARLGIKTGFIGTLGDDPEGELILNEMSKAGINTKQIKKLKSELTSKVLVFVNAKGERAMYSLPAASTKFELSDSDIDIINRSKYLIISAIPAERSINKIIRMTQQLDDMVKLVFLPGGLYSKLGQKVLLPILKRTDILILNRREFSSLTKAAETYKKGFNRLQNIGTKNVIITAGSAGAIVQGEGYGEHYRTVPAEKLSTAQVIDSTGAGDAFTAGVVFGLMNNMSLHQAAACGNLAGRSCIQALGARAGLVDVNEMKKSIKNN